MEGIDTSGTSVSLSYLGGSWLVVNGGYRVPLRVLWGFYRVL